MESISSTNFVDTEFFYSRRSLLATLATETYNGYHVPESAAGGLVRYITERVPTGDFLRAVLENDLFEAVGRADANSLAALPAICGWIYNNAPADCFGSPSKVKEWLK